MPVTDQILNELKELKEQGRKLYSSGRDDYDLLGLSSDYETWYTKALAVIQQISPERATDFREEYKKGKRRTITAETYGISDYLLGTVVSRRGRLTFDTQQVYLARLYRQTAILAAAVDIAPTFLRDISTEIRAELLDSDVESAKGLLKAKHHRSAGVVCGVVLEAHLQSILKRRAISLGRKKPTLGNLNEALKTANVYDIPMWRLIQRLADIRNLCAHSGNREPKSEEVEDLISGTEKVIKEVF